jgi:predicted nucleotidyltransferase component of viral defense system
MKDIIQRKLDSYQSKTEQDEENALKEITQEVCLYALARSGFFEKATFQGGRCLHMVYGPDLFSEDLDFALVNPDKKFELAPYLTKSSELMKAYGHKHAF